MSLRVVVADDQPIVRAGIALLLASEPDITVVAEACDGEQAVQCAREHDPDVVVMDIRMPGVDGITATRRIVEDAGTPPDHVVQVLVLTTFHDDDLVYDALRAGASGYLLKQAAPQDLANAVRRAAAGEAWIDPAVARQVISALGRVPRHLAGRPGAALAHLTVREREVLVLMAHGMTNGAIRERLVLSEATVKTHVSRILMKTGSHDRAAAVALAYRSGLVQAGPG